MKKEYVEKVGARYRDNTVVLLGNGINNLSNGFRWDQLLRKMAIDHDVSEKKLNQLSYPLTFDELVAKAYVSKSRKPNSTYNHFLNELKITLAQVLDDMPFHEHLLSFKSSSILTTNYDYCLERAHGIDWHTEITKEYKHSLFRHNRNENKAIWHIHGELDNKRSTNKSESIMIGHEHYGDYFKSIYDFIIKHNEESKSSWVDSLFNKDVHIVGLSLDFSEFHLWWLLSFRARMKLAFPKSVKNKIIFHYPSYENKNYGDRLKSLQTLDCGLDMIKVNIKDDSKYEKYWEKFFKRNEFL